MVVALQSARYAVLVATIVAIASFAGGASAATGARNTNGEIVERAARKTVEGTSRIAVGFAFNDWRRVGFSGAGIRDYRNDRGFLTARLDFQTCQTMLPTLRRWLGDRRLTQTGARSFRFDVAFSGRASQLRIRKRNEPFRWRSVEPPTGEQFIFSSLAAVNGDPVRVVRWLRLVSSRVMLPAYGHNVQVRGIDTTQYVFEIDPAKAARALLPHFSMDQSRAATLAQLHSEIRRKQIQISASV